MTMTLAQYKELRELGRLFEQGLAQPSHIRKLSELLSLINESDNNQQLAKTEFDPQQTMINQP